MVGWPSTAPVNIYDNQPCSMFWPTRWLESADFNHQKGSGFDTCWDFPNLLGTKRRFKGVVHGFFPREIETVLENPLSLGGCWFHFVGWRQKIYAIVYFPDPVGFLKIQKNLVIIRALGILTHQNFTWPEDECILFRQPVQFLDTKLQRILALKSQDSPIELCLCPV